MDRRIQSTHDRLVSALRSLMQQKPWDGISVAHICREANVSRSSYYAHFSGKQDLFDLSLRYLSRELVPNDSNRSLTITSSFAFLPGFLEHIKEHRAIYVENRFGTALLTITQNIRAIALGLARHEVVAESQLKPPLSKIDDDTLLFAAGGAYALIEIWIDSGCAEPTGGLVERLDALIGNALRLSDD